MRKTSIYIFILLLAGLAFADIVIPAGTCQNFTLFNESDNSTSVQSICAENATIIQNITENITYSCPEVTMTMYANSTRTVNNVTVTCIGNTTFQEVPVPFCNATNGTLWANSTGVFNNATVTCLGNLTVVENITNLTTYCPEVTMTMYANSTRTINNASVTCLGNQSVIYNNSSCGTYSGIFTPDGTTQYVNNTVVNLTVNPIPSNWCFENRSENATAPALFRSDRGNNTFICNAPLYPFAVPVQNQTCTNTTQYIYEITHDVQNVSCERKTRVDICTDQITNQYEAALLLKGDGIGWVNTKIQDCNSTINSLQQAINGPQGYLSQMQKLQDQVNQNMTIQGSVDDSIDKKLSGPLFWGVGLFLFACLMTVLIYVGMKMNERRRISASDFPEKTSDAVINKLQGAGKGKWAAPEEQ
jgi:hypothetical protein